MPSFEIESDDARNPYRALVISPNNFGDGDLRVEPPFYPSDSYLENLLQTEQDVVVRNPISGQEATTLNFEVVEDSSHNKSNEERVRLTVEALIRDLGSIASEELFKKTNSY